jgi:RES domain-containing protein
MLLYRICLTKYASNLYASGQAGRWNFGGEKVIYTAGTVALACLENLVHRAGAALADDFTLLTIFVPPVVGIGQISDEQLPEGWEQNPFFSLKLGNRWLMISETGICKVPSAIIQQEHNYLLNPNHIDFPAIQIVYRQPFNFDKRLTSDFRE